MDATWYLGSPDAPLALGELWALEFQLSVSRMVRWSSTPGLSRLPVAGNRPWGGTWCLQLPRVPPHAHNVFCLVN